jgi:hypothetical protein
VAKAEWGRFDPDIPATFDSRFLRHQDRLFHFRGKIMNGGELNYYFQGMYWKELGVRRQDMIAIIYTYKAYKYQSLPSANDLQRCLRRL